MAFGYSLQKPHIFLCKLFFTKNTSLLTTSPANSVLFNKDKIFHIWSMMYTPISLSLLRKWTFRSHSFFFFFPFHSYGVVINVFVCFPFPPPHGCFSSYTKDFQKWGTKEQRFRFMNLIARCLQNFKLPMITVFPFVYIHSSIGYKLFLIFTYLIKIPLVFKKFDATERHILFTFVFGFGISLSSGFTLTTLLICLKNPLLFTLTTFLVVFFNFNLFFCSFYSFPNVMK